MNLKKLIYSLFKLIATIKVSRNNDFSSRIFIYHNVSGLKSEVFRDQINIIKEKFDEIVCASDFVELSNNNKINSKKYACITFDDGFDDVYQNAKPILDELKVTATIFLNQKLYDLTNFNKDNLDDFVKNKFPRLSKTENSLNGLSKSQLEELILDGYEIGGHTINHESVSKMNKIDFEKELVYQLQYVQEHFKYDIKSFAYPYGRKKDIPVWGASSLQNCGYKTGFSGISYNLTKLNDIKTFEFPRTSVSLDLSKKEFLNLIKGSSDILDSLTGQHS